MAATLKKQRPPRHLLSLPLDDCPIERLRFKVYTTASPNDDPAGLIGTTILRQSAEPHQPGNRLIAIIEAPKLSFAHGDDFFINRPCDHAKLGGESVPRSHCREPESQRYTLIVLRAHEALRAAFKSEHSLSLIWADGDSRDRRLRRQESLGLSPKACRLRHASESVRYRATEIAAQA